MRSTYSKIISVILTFLVAFTIITISASSIGFASKEQPGVYVICGEYKHTFSLKNYGNNMTRTLSNALKIAGDKASDKRKAYVYVSPGEYKITETLLIYSNTNLVTEGVIFSGSCNFLRNGFDNDKTTAKRYNGARNISVTGGIWNMDVPYERANSTDARFIHSSFRFAHCKNITVKNCILKNNYNAHDIELGGVYIVKIKNCKFINDKSVNKYGVVLGKEAIQIDVNTEKSMPYIPEYDYTPTESVVVNNCLFKNKFCGIGSHHGVIGNPYRNIRIKNNVFKNISCYAISATYWYNIDIGNNIFKNVGSGIDIYSVSNLSWKNLMNYFNYSYEDTLNTVYNSQAYIYGNKIKVRNKNNHLKNTFGIKISGSKYSEDNENTNIKAGTYYFYSLFLDRSPNWEYINNIVNSYADEKIILKYVK